MLQQDCNVGYFIPSPNVYPCLVQIYKEQNFQLRT